MKSVERTNTFQGFMSYKSDAIDKNDLKSTKKITTVTNP